MVKLGRYAIIGLLHDDDAVTEFKLEDDDHENIEELNSLCRIGFLSCHRSPTTAKESYTFDAKSFQEECAGEYLAKLADDHCQSFRSTLEELGCNSLINIQRVLRIACIASRWACHQIIQRIAYVYNHVSNSSEVDKEEKDVRLENLVLLGLQINFESNHQEDVSTILMSLFPTGCIRLSKLSMTGPLAYFLRRNKISALQIRSTDHLEEKASGVNLLELFGDSFIQELPERSKRLDFYESTNVKTLFKSFRFTNLLSLVMEGVYLHGQIDYLMTIIGNGHLRLLQELRLPFAHLNQDDLRQMGPLDKLDQLQIIDVSNNKAGAGLDFLIDTLIGRPLRELDISNMGASAEIVLHVLKQLRNFCSLQKVLLKGNQISEEISVELMATAQVTCTWKDISLSVSNLCEFVIHEFGEALKYLQQLQSLRIYDIDDPEVIFNVMLNVLPALPELKTFLLETEKKMPLAITEQTWRSFMYILEASRNMCSVTLHGIILSDDDLGHLLQHCHYTKYSHLG